MYLAQHNQLLDEGAATLMCQCSLDKVPSLLEWAVSAVHINQIPLQYGIVPDTLIGKHNTSLVYKKFVINTQKLLI